MSADAFREVQSCSLGERPLRFDMYSNRSRSPIAGRELIYVLLGPSSEAVDAWQLDNEMLFRRPRSGVST